MRAVVQAAVRAWGWLPLPLGSAVTVLGYHRVDEVHDELAVHPSTFAAHLDFLSSRRHETPVLELHDALEHLSRPGDRPPRRAVVLTFDDAWADNHTHALGPLVERGLPATVYVPSKQLGTPGRLTPSQLLEMDAAGITIGAHSRTHPDLRACTAAELEAEVRGCREDLEDMLGKPVTSFAYPSGLHARRVCAAVAAAGYRSAVTTRRATCRSDVDWLRIPRNIVEDYGTATFAATVRGGSNVLRLADSVEAALRYR
jgi:peptidoglycan/xylan/chitin deacetylase (PgdA/CDA1 family)